MARILALDIGTKRTGIAITDDSQTIAQPFDFTVEPGKLASLIESLSSDYELEKIIVGLPKTMAGEEGSQAEYSKKIATDLAAAVAIPIEFVDERLTTKQAVRLQHSGATTPLDCLAAQQLLEYYLLNK